MIAAIYARKSTEQNGVADEARSVARQVEHARLYAKLKGWTVADDQVYVDDGVSGAEFAKRPGFLRLMNALKPRPLFQVLIMSEESRLGREAIETAYALKQLITAGVRVFFYLEDRERTLDSPTDKIMLSLTAFADELERERARQRTYDAMAQKARAGHVTGGRVFGYENVPVLLPDGRRAHVERRVEPREAAVVRRIFQLCADGAGQARIAKALNAEHASAPRSQRGRPRGWAPSSVHEVLYRDLYRGVVVWNKTRKRDRWGQQRRSARPESDWMRQHMPELQIVPDVLWSAAHRWLGSARERYLRATDGRLFGRPKDVDSKYLLPGFARCGCCNGGFHVRSRSHGKERAFFYACTSYHTRGPSVCQNSLEGSMPLIDQAVLSAIAGDVLHPDLVDRVVERVKGALEPQTATRDVSRLRRELSAVESELARLAEAIAAGGNLPELLTAIQARQSRRTELSGAVASAEARLGAVDVRQIERELRRRLQDWRSVLTTNVPQGRQMFRKLLQGPIWFTPVEEGTKRGFEFRGEASLGKLFSGIIDLPMMLASPTGLSKLAPIGGRLLTAA